MTRAQLSEKNLNVTCAISDALALCHPLFDGRLLKILQRAEQASREMNFYIARCLEAQEKEGARRAEREAFAAAAREQEEAAQ